MSSMPVNGSEPAPATAVGYAPPAVGMHSGPSHGSAVGMQPCMQGPSSAVFGIDVVVVVVGTLVVVVGTLVVVTGVDVVGVEVVVTGTSVVVVVVTGGVVVDVLVSLDAAVVVSLVSLAAAVGTRTTRPTSAAAMAMVRFTVVLPNRWCCVPDDEPVLVSSP
ncbi:MAG: hypothetical protein JWL76_1350 [Thermoleophilia bacterium]|nr:hypothetical protein [Thermoleophilia bacterium]